MGTLVPSGHLCIYFCDIHIAACRGQSVTARCCRMGCPELRTAVCPLFLGACQRAGLSGLWSEWLTCGISGMQGAPLFSPCSAMPGARLTWTLLSYSPGVTILCPQAECPALHLVGPQYVFCLIETSPSSLVLITVPGDETITQGFPFRAIGGSESVFGTSPDISSIDVAAQPPSQSAHLPCHWHKGHSQGGPGRSLV